MRIALLFALTASLNAQRLSLGIVVGGSPTDAFQNITELQPQGTHSTRAYSQSKDWLAGASLEIRLARGWSIEADAIFRQLHLVQAQPQAGGTLTPFARTPVVTWETPVLAKYRLPVGRARPFIEAGPTHRTIGNLNATHPSRFGATAGAGVELHWRKLKISPTVRFTRWQKDDPRYRPTQTAPNQIELILGFSAESISHWKPLGRHASVGLILGASLTADGRSESLTSTVNRDTTATFTTTSGHSLISGPAFDFELPGHLTLEVDALYRPVIFRQTVRLQGAPLPPFLANSFRDITAKRPTWEFPVLLKYHFTTGRLHPSLGAGPTFRRPQGLSTPSPYGIVAAAGLETHWSKMTIAPSLRFSHWGPDRLGSDFRVLRNQTELLVGFSF